MNTPRFLSLGLAALVALGCSGGAPPEEKPTGQIDKSATDLSTAKPTNDNDKFNRFQAPN